MDSSFPDRHVCIFKYTGYLQTDFGALNVNTSLYHVILFTLFLIERTTILLEFYQMLHFIS